VLEPDETIASRRLSELRAAQPGDPTLRNLLGVLTAKLELSARLPICEYEAGTQGHAAAGTAFHRLAESERRSFNDLLAALRQHLDETAAARTAVAPASEGTAT
jgi:hypothetical protein